MNIKSQKGSVTLFVLVSCLFFLASVVCVNMYVQNKQVAVDREYKIVKANYEKDVDNMESIYTELFSKKNREVMYFTDSIVIDNTQKKISISVFTNLEYLNVNTLKYAWIYSSTEIDNLLEQPTENISNWTYVEVQNGENEFVASTNYDEEGYYYLCTMIDNQAFWKQDPIEITNES